MASAFKYISNLGKSVAYSTMDRVKDMNPSIAAFSEQNAELGKALYASVKDIRGTIQKGKKYVVESSIGEFGREYKKAFFEDLKSGKFYNRERDADLGLKAAGDTGQLGDDSWDALLSEIDVDDGSSSDSMPDISVDDSDSGKMIKSIDNIGGKVTNGIAEATGRAAEYQIEAYKSGVSAQQKHLAAMTDKLNFGIASVNSTIAQLVQFNHEASKLHYNNSADFYGKMVTKIDTTNTLLQKLVDGQAKMYGGDDDKQKKNSGRGNTYSELTNDGMVDIAAYFKVVKENLNAVSNGLLDLNSSLGEGSNALLSFASSPLQFIPNYFAKKIVPDIVESSIKEFNTTLSGVFSGLMMKANDMRNSDDTIKEYIGRLLGISMEKKTSIKTNTYNKGVIPWDGESKMALTRVIPDYLAKILAAQTGTSEKLFDYQSGKYIDIEHLAEELSNKERSYSDRAASDMISTMKEMLKGVDFSGNKESYDSLIEDIHSMFQKMFSEGTILPLNKKDAKAWELGVSSADNAEIITAMIQNIIEEYNPEKGKYGQNNKAMLVDLTRNIMEAREGLTREFKSLEENASSIYRNVYNMFNGGEFHTMLGSGKDKYSPQDIRELDLKKNKNPNLMNNIYLVKDEYGKNVFYYLQQYALEFEKMRTDGVHVATIDYIPPAGDDSGYSYDSSLKGRPAVRRRRRRRPNTSLHSANDVIGETQKYSKRQDYMDREIQSFNASQKSNIDRLKENREKASDEGAHTVDYDYLLYGGDDDNLSDTEGGFTAVQKRWNAYFATNNEYRKTVAQMKDQSNKEKKRKKGLAEKLMNVEEVDSRFINFIEGVDELTSKPSEFIAGVIGKVDKRLFEIIYGNEDDDKLSAKSFMSNLIGRLTFVFSNFTDFMKDEVFSPLKETLFGDEESSLKSKVKDFFGSEDTKEFLHKMFDDKWDYVKNAFKDTYGKALGLTGDEKEEDIVNAMSEKMDRKNIAHLATNLKLDKQQKEKQAKLAESKELIQLYGSGKDKASQIQLEMNYALINGEYSKAKKLSFELDKLRAAGEEEVFYKPIKDITQVSTGGGRVITDQAHIDKLRESESAITSQFNSLYGDMPTQLQAKLDKLKALPKKERDRKDVKEEIKRIESLLANIETDRKEKRTEAIRRSGIRIAKDTARSAQLDNAERLGDESVTLNRQFGTAFVKMQEELSRLEELISGYNETKDQLTSEIEQLTAQLEGIDKSDRSKENILKMNDITRKLNDRKSRLERNYQSSYGELNKYTIDTTIAGINKGLTTKDIIKKGLGRVFTDDKVVGNLEDELASIIDRMDTITDTNSQEYKGKDSQEYKDLFKQKLKLMKTIKTLKAYSPSKDKDGNFIGMSREEIEGMNKFATGGQVDKTGIAAVSEGELILPPEMNPFYTKTSNIHQRMMKENDAKKNFIGFVNSLYDKKLSTRKIAQFAGAGTSSVNENGDVTRIPIPSNRESETSADDSEAAPQRSKEEINQQIREMSSNGVSDEDIAKAVGVSQKEVRKVLGHNRIFHNLRFSSEEKKRINEMAEQGMSNEQIAAAFHCTPEQIDTAINRDRFGNRMGEAVVGLGNGFKEIFKRSGIKDGIKEIEEALSNTAKEIDTTEEDKEKLYESMVADVKEGKDKYLPSALGAGVIGAGVSLLTGAIGGPLLGAAIGAGTDLVVKSQSIQNWLFGEVGEDGLRKGNILSKDLSNKITKYFPDMGKGAVVGGITSILPFVPGGPVAGIIVGSSIGFAKNNEKIRTYLFGEEDDEESGLLSKKRREFLKKHVPEAILGGGIGGLLLSGGPFGLVGGILLGGATGFASQTETFKDALFGKVNSETGEREGGLIGALRDGFVRPLVEFGKDFGTKAKDWIKEDIVDPISRAFNPIVKQIGVVVGSIGSFITGKVGDMLEPKLGGGLKNLGMNIGSSVKKNLGRAAKVGGFLTRPSLDVISSPFRMVGAVGDHFRRRQIQKGNANYMTSEERNTYRDEMERNVIYEKYKKDEYGKDEEGNKVLLHRKGEIKKDEYGNPIESKKMKYKYFQKTLNRRGLNTHHGLGLLRHPLENPDKFEQFDRDIANMSAEDINALSESLNILSSKDKIKSKKLKTIDDINNIFTGTFAEKIGDKNRRKLMGILGDKNLDDDQKFKKATIAINKLQQNGTIDDDTFMHLKSQFTQKYSDYQALSDIEDDKNGARSRAFETLRNKYGWAGFTEKNLDKVKGLVDQEKKIKEKMSPIDQLNDKQEKRHEKIVDLFEELIYTVQHLDSPESIAKYKQEKINKNAKISAKRSGLAFFSPLRKDNSAFANKQMRPHPDPEKMEQGIYQVSNGADENGNTIWVDVDQNGNQLDENGNIVTSENGETANIKQGTIFSKSLGFAKKSVKFPFRNFWNKNDTNLYQKGVIGIGNKMSKKFNVAIRDRAEFEDENNYNEYLKEKESEVDAYLTKKSKGRLFGSRIRKRFKNEILNENLGQEERIAKKSEIASEKSRTVSDFMGNPVKWVKNQKDEWVEEHKSSEKIRDKATIAFLDKVASPITRKIGDLASDVKGAFERLFHIDEEDGWGKKMLKIATGIGGALTIAGFMPILETYWDNKVSPKIKDFWDQSIYPKIEQYIAPIKPTIAKAAVGIDAAIRSIPTAIENLGYKIHNFLVYDLPTIWTNKIIPFYTNGIDWVTNKVEKGTEILTKGILTIAPSIIKGILNGVKAIVFGEGKDSTSMSIVSPSSNVVESQVSRVQSYAESMAQENNGLFTSAYKNLFGSNPYEDISNYEGKNKNNKAAADYYNGENNEYPYDILDAGDVGTTIQNTNNPASLSVGVQNSVLPSIEQVSYSSTTGSYETSSNASDMTNVDVSSVSTGSGSGLIRIGGRKSIHLPSAKGSGLPDAEDSYENNNTTKYGVSSYNSDYVSGGYYDERGFVSTATDAFASMKSNMSSAFSDIPEQVKQTYMQTLYGIEGVPTPRNGNTIVEEGTVGLVRSKDGINYFDQNYITDSGQSLNGAIVSNSCLVFDRYSNFIPNIFYDPQTGLFTNTPTNSAINHYKKNVVAKAEGYVPATIFDSHDEALLKKHDSDPSLYQDNIAYLVGQHSGTSLSIASAQNYKDIVHSNSDRSSIGSRFIENRARNLISGGVYGSSRGVTKIGNALSYAGRHIPIGKISAGVPLRITGFGIRNTTKLGEPVEKLAKNTTGRAYKAIENKIKSKFTRSATEEVAENVAKQTTKNTAENVAEAAMKDTAKAVTSDSVLNNKTYIDAIQHGMADDEARFAANQTKQLLELTGKDVIEESAESIAKKSGTEVIESVSESAVKEAVGDTVKEESKGVIKKATEAITSAFGNRQIKELAKDAMEKGGKEFSEAAFKEAGENIAKRIAKYLAKKSLNLAGKGLAALVRLGGGALTGGLVTAAFAVADFLHGYSDTTVASTFNITVDVLNGDTVGWRKWPLKIISGVLNMICGIIAYGIIPIDMILNIVSDIIFNLFGLDQKDIEKIKSESAEEMRQYNLEHGTNYTDVEDYNRRNSLTSKFKRLIGMDDGSQGPKERDIDDVVLDVTEDMINNDYGNNIKKDRDERAMRAYRSFAQAHKGQEIFLSKNSKTKSLADLMKEDQSAKGSGIIMFDDDNTETQGHDTAFMKKIKEVISNNSSNSNQKQYSSADFISDMESAKTEDDKKKFVNAYNTWKEERPLYPNRTPYYYLPEHLIPSNTYAQYDKLGYFSASGSGLPLYDYSAKGTEADNSAQQQVLDYAKDYNLSGSLLDQYLYGLGNPSWISSKPQNLYQSYMKYADSTYDPLNPNKSSTNAFGLVTTKTPTQKKEEDANRRKTLESNGQTISDTDWNNYLIARKYYTLNPSEYISDKNGTPAEVPALVQAQDGVNTAQTEATTTESTDELMGNPDMPYIVQNEYGMVLGTYKSKEKAIKKGNKLSPSAFSIINNGQTIYNSNKDTPLDSVQTVTDLSRSTNMLNDMIYCMMFIESGCSYAAAKWDNGAKGTSMSLGILQWKGADARNLLYTIASSDKNVAKDLLGESFYNDIIQKKTKLFTNDPSVRNGITKLLINGKQIQIDTALSDAKKLLKKGKKKWKNPKVIIFWAMVCAYVKDIGMDMLNNTVFGEDCSLDTFFKAFINNYDIYQEASEKYNKMYNLALRSPVTKINEKFDQKVLEACISSEYEEEDESHNWLSQLFAAIANMGKAMFGLADPEDAVEATNVDTTAYDEYSSELINTIDPYSLSTMKDYMVKVADRSLALKERCKYLRNMIEIDKITAVKALEDNEECAKFFDDISFSSEYLKYAELGEGKYKKKANILNDKNLAKSVNTQYSDYLNNESTIYNLNSASADESTVKDSLQYFIYYFTNTGKNDDVRKLSVPNKTYPGPFNCLYFTDFLSTNEELVSNLKGTKINVIEYLNSIIDDSYNAYVKGEYTLLSERDTRALTLAYETLADTWHRGYDEKGNQLADVKLDETSDEAKESAWNTINSIYTYDMNPKVVPDTIDDYKQRYPSVIDFDALKEYTKYKLTGETVYDSNGYPKFTTPPTNPYTDKIAIKKNQLSYIDNKRIPNTNYTYKEVADAYFRGNVNPELTKINNDLYKKYWTMEEAVGNVYYKKAYDQESKVYNPGSNENIINSITENGPYDENLYYYYNAWKNIPQNTHAHISDYLTEQSTSNSVNTFIGDPKINWTELMHARARYDIYNVRNKNDIEDDDVSDQDIANANIMYNMEYNRALELVKDGARISDKYVSDNGAVYGNFYDEGVFDYYNRKKIVDDYMSANYIDQKYDPNNIDYASLSNNTTNNNDYYYYTHADTENQTLFSKERPITKYTGDDYLYDGYDNNEKDKIRMYNGGLISSNYKAELKERMGLPNTYKDFNKSILNPTITPNNPFGLKTTTKNENAVYNYDNNSSRFSAKGSGFVSQLDYANQYFSDGESLAQAGCGPAVAAMAINNLAAKGSGSNLMGATAAIANSYKNGGGTQASYFGDVMGRVGASTSYTTSKSDIKSNLKKGNQVVLMGRDSSNKSKANSPYGPNNHYVLATGLGNGKVQISDPEQRRPAIYDEKILNNTKLGVAISGRGSGLIKKANNKALGKVMSAKGSTSSSTSTITGTTYNVPADCGTEWGYQAQDHLGYKAGEIIDASTTDDAGCRIVNGRFCVSLTPYLASNSKYTYFGTEDTIEWKSSMGDQEMNGRYFDVYLSDGTRIPCIVCDIKGTDNKKGDKCDWGHHNGKQLLEFVKCKGIKWNDNPGSRAFVNQFNKKPYNSWGPGSSGSYGKKVDKVVVADVTWFQNPNIYADTWIEGTGVPHDTSGGSSSSGNSDSTDDKNDGSTWMSTLISEFGKAGAAWFGNSEGSSSDSDGSSSASGVSNGEWVDVVKAVKKALAETGRGYSSGNVDITLDINGSSKTLSVRTDCSGLVSACVSFYSGKNVTLDSSGFANADNAAMKDAGFTSRKWNGWNDLVEGDIIAKSGHVEIFCRNEEGKHYVYNAGGDKSIKSAGATGTGHKEGYTTVWSPSGKGSGLINSLFRNINISSAKGSGVNHSSVYSTIKDSTSGRSKLSKSDNAMNSITGSISNRKGSKLISYINNTSSSAKGSGVVVHSSVHSALKDSIAAGSKLSKSDNAMNSITRSISNRTDKIGLTTDTRTSRSINNYLSNSTGRGTSTLRNSISSSSPSTKLANNLLKSTSNNKVSKNNKSYITSSGSTSSAKGSGIEQVSLNEVLAQSRTRVEEMKSSGNYDRESLTVLYAISTLLAANVNNSNEIHTIVELFKKLLKAKDISTDGTNKTKSSKSTSKKSSSKKSGKGSGIDLESYIAGGSDMAKSINNSNIERVNNVLQSVAAGSGNDGEEEPNNDLVNLISNLEAICSK